MTRVRKDTMGNNSWQLPISKKGYSVVVVNPRFCYLRPQNDASASMAEEISFSLTRKRRFIHPKFFYDDRGSEIFDRICTLPEYYLTRSEMEILDSIGPEFSQFLEDHVLVELGSGSSIKTRKLLEVFDKKQETVEYYPIDISGILEESSVSLQEYCKNLRVTGIIDQYESGLDFIKRLELKKIIAFLGSSLGNFDNKSAIKMLKKIRSTMRQGDLFLLGLDLVKDRRIIESAYNDFSGVTSQFNLNLLARINGELGGNFNLENFAHMALYNTRHKRIEMYLSSKCEQQISISKINLSINLGKDEKILTEYSYKYTVPQIEEMAQKVGFTIKKIWFDKNRFFSLVLFSA